MEAPEIPVDWDHVYLLGWYDRERRSYLTTWDGDLPMVNVVVLGLPSHRMPMWDAPVPPQAELRRVPDDQDPHEYAASLGGYHAFGWLVADGVKRSAW